MTAVSNEATRVMARALIDVGLVTDCQKLEGLWVTALTATAASGSRTMTLR
jgi:hypothetical protein